MISERNYCTVLTKWHELPRNEVKNKKRRIIHAKKETYEHTYGSHYAYNVIDSMRRWGEYAKYSCDNGGFRFQGGNQG